MTESEREMSEILDDMALKILMIEPGDLSVVGELLSFTEELIARRDIADFSVLHRMGVIFNSALEKIIMGELADSAENYSCLGQCIVQMQEIVRKEGEAGSPLIKEFCKSLRDIGMEVDEAVFAEGEVSAEKQTEAAVLEDSAVDAEKPSASSAAPPDFLHDTDLLSGFIEEAFEHLESIEVNVLELENNPDDEEIINNIFRPFHTIKGVSGFLNLTIINKLAHATENLLDDVRNGKLAMNSDVIDIVLNVGDCLTSMVENVKEVLESGMEAYQETDISEFLENIKRIQHGEEAPAAAQTGAAIEPEGVADVSEVPDAGVDPDSEPQSVVPEIVPANSFASTASPKGTKPAAGKGAGQKGRIGSSVKVDVEKLDGLVNAVGELVIMQSLVRQNPLVIGIADPKLTRDFSQLGRITSEIQKVAMSMRMVPIRQTFDKMIRLVRDLSKKSGKKVDLIMEGTETEIDRNMVDSIYDPLVHMMRNSVDHGVRFPEEREAVGKPGTGTVKLSAYQKGGNIVIEIEDDGDGLNTRKIRKKAIDRGLIQESDHLSDHELNNLIFVPGFSTADKITDVSGRGVGMDVVKKGVEKLRGKVEVNSQPGKGTQFLMRLPLTLAIIDGIIVGVGPERYIIPTIAIQESMHPERKNYNTIHGKGETLLVRNRLIPIIRLYELFGVEPLYDDPCDAIVVVVENEGRCRALMVDELLGKEEVVIKSMGGYLKDIPGIAGGTILGDGRVGLILDLAGVIASSETMDRRVPVKTQKEALEIEPVDAEAIMEA